MIKIISAVSNDIVTDNRIHKIALSLIDHGYDVSIIGRKLKSSPKLEKRPYHSYRFRLCFNKGPLFYLSLNLHLFFYLLRSKASIIISNDLDTLPGSYFASKLTKKKLVFDSHELFSEVPELVGRPKIKAIWLMLEKLLIPKIDAGLTVSQSIADIYEKLYGKKFEVISNASKFRYDCEFDEIVRNNNEKILIYQGALNIGRGIELIIESMKFIDSVVLHIIGSGDLTKELKRKVKKLGLNEKIKFFGRIALDNLWKYTSVAQIGFSLEEDIGLNYRYSMPNKLFDYIQARVPVIVSDLPEMSKLVKKYDIGKILVERKPEALARLINQMVSEELPNAKYETQLALASRELCWEKEEERLIAIFKRVHGPVLADIYE